MLSPIMLGFLFLAMVLTVLFMAAGVAVWKGYDWARPMLLLLLGWGTLGALTILMSGRVEGAVVQLLQIAFLTLPGLKITSRPGVEAQDADA